jgi:putative ATP-binding cassette transporter
VGARAFPLSSQPQAIPPEKASSRALAQLGSLLRALMVSRARNRIALLAIGLGLVICANAVGQIRLNSWNGDFYDALEQKDVAAFSFQLLVFLIIVASLLMLVVTQTWLGEIIKIRLREWLTHDLLDEWLAPKRAYFIAFAGEIGTNPDQRIQEDARHLCELSAELGAGLLQASLLLASFIGVLWLLSTLVAFTVAGQEYDIPGYMVWCALAYALAGSWLTWRVGGPLIQLNADRYGREAEFRFALVRVSERAEGVGLYRGESDERRALNAAVNRVMASMRRLATGLTRLTWITSGYGWLVIVVPIAVAAPGYFGGSLSLGGLMMVVGAFNQVQQALRWFVDNFSRIADWRATLLRVVAFRDGLLVLELPDGGVSRVEIADHPNGHLSLEQLTVFHFGGRATLEEPNVEILPGERVLIVGEPGSGKSTLFLAIAGLWPWGSGRIRLPPRDSMMFMPQQPYLPPGTLRAAITYPAEPERFELGAVEDALWRVRLDYLLPSLDQEARWDRELSLDEQQRLACVRMTLHAPKWIVLDDAMSAVAEEHRPLIMALFDGVLAGSAVICMSRVPSRDTLYSRVMRLLHLPPEVPLHLAPPVRQRERPSQLSS